ncbi:MAG: type VI secretion system tip protein VgrG [Blastocatellia bacterium]|nr:type VI secretion system tip protein VgrG [Blastocatellia bacterium]
MGEYKQDNRFIQVFTPLGEDILLLESFHGQEGVSRLFNFELLMHSENMELSFNDIVGKTTTVKISWPDKPERNINGIISSFRQGGSSPLMDGERPTSVASYYATLVPWLWVLTRTGDCRIFQHKTVPDILTYVFQDHKFADFEFRLHGCFEEREYCVQYRETDFNFVSRLMEEEGIYYFFEHYENKHVLVLADHHNEFKPSPLLQEGSISYNSVRGYERGGVIREWNASQEVRPGQYTVTDFNFMQPSIDLTYSVNGKDERKLEVYDYPGEYTAKTQAERLATLRIEEEQSSMMVYQGASTCYEIAPGIRFDLRDHYRRNFNQTYAVISVYHSAMQGTRYRSALETAASEFIYSNEFQCIPHGTPYRPPRVTPVPIVHGSQTAIVVGPKNEEIFVDKYGRVKVQFHWDREGQYNENSSCWVRVSQNWAGKRWGAVFLPRIGQEVIVDFLEGDPDKPIITGRVYNGESMPPYDLTVSANKTMSAIKSNSSMGGGGFNEIRFQDLKGSEQLFIHAERDHDVRIKNDHLELVGNESHLTVNKNQLEKVGGDKHLQVAGDRNEQVGATASLTAGSEILRKAGNRYALEAGKEIHLIAGSNLVIEAGSTLTLKVGGNFITFDGGGIFIQGTKVMINSGGTSYSGSGAVPELPMTPKPPVSAEQGAKAQLPPEKTPVKPQGYCAGALVLKQAAIDGTPFCEKCSTTDDNA